MEQENPSPEVIGAFMVVMTSVIEKCKDDGAQTKSGQPIDFAALVERFARGVLHPSSGVELTDLDRHFCACLIAMFLNRIGSVPDQVH